MRRPRRFVSVRAMTAVAAPRWSLRSPSAAAVREFLAEQKGQEFAYAAVGATRASGALELPGYDFDWNTVLLGEGEAVFVRGCAALKAWRMFPSPWTRIAPDEAPLREGQTLAMQARAFGAWWLNACRIVYLVDELQGGVRRFGFAYGTLPAHVEAGEERFTVELHPDGAVWYELRAFSRPRYWPVRLAKPLARRLQRRFVRESLAAMRAAVGAPAGGGR